MFQRSGVEGMGKDKNRKNRKDSQLVLRLPKRERDGFVELCDDIDTSASREIRKFIRAYLKDHDRVPEDGD